MENSVSLIKTIDNQQPRKKSRGCAVVGLLLIFLFALPWLWRWAVRAYYQQHIYTIETTPSEQVAIVFGAAVYSNGRLSSVLRDRMDTAIELYENGQVNKIVVSGDNSTYDYNEPGAMLDYAIARGVPAEDVQPDYGGRRTYDSCYRARDIFQIESAILVTQEFHLPRAIFTCRRLGIDAVGVGADLRPYRGARWYEFRETVATAVAFWDTLRQVPPPVLGSPIPLN